MKIAFLDHHLDNWHAKVFLGLLRERGHEVVAWESHPIGEDWCATNGVERADDSMAAVNAADAIMVLAPDDVECHGLLSLEALASGKPTFVDKLLAASAAEAESMIDRAAKHGTPLTAASSLRHAAELEDALDARPVEEGFFSGYGTWDRYGVHTVAMALRAMGGGVRRLANVGTAAMPTLALEWRDGRRATLVVADGADANKAFPWRFALRREGSYTHGTVTQFDEFYRRQLDATLEAFENRASMDRDEMLDIVRILERAPQAGEGWIVL